MSTIVQNLTFATRALEKEMGQLTKSIFFFGDGLQRTVVDGAFDLLKPKTWQPANLVRFGRDTAEISVELSRFLTPGEAGIAWEELRNKLEVFLLVSELSSILQVDPKTWVPLSDLVNRAYSLPAFAALWAVEGVGHYYGDAYWERNGPPSGLLSANSVSVPEKSLLMLHAGMGLAFADRLLDTVTHSSPAYEIRGVVEQFVELCRNNSRPGYLGSAVESLGLVTRDFYPDMVSLVDEQVQEVAPELRGYFWHGVGRALYFSRAYFLPVLRTAWGSLDQEAQPGTGLTNAMAGLAWAATLVNMRQPAVMEGVLRSYLYRSELADAFAYGVSTSIMMREDTTPGKEFVKAFYEYQPDSIDRRLVITWNKRVSGPAKHVLRSYYPMLKRQGLLGEVFQYQSLATVVDRLEGEVVRSSAGAGLQ